MAEFKPNLYPIMYWGLLFGLVAGVLLFVLMLLSRFITVIWFPVFLAGLLYGGYRNYQKQRRAWAAGRGESVGSQNPMQEFKEAAQDIVGATRDMMAEQETGEVIEEPAVDVPSVQEAPPAPAPPPARPASRPTSPVSRPPAPGGVTSPQPPRADTDKEKSGTTS